MNLVQITGSFEISELCYYYEVANVELWSLKNLQLLFEKTFLMIKIIVSYTVGL